MHTVSSFSTTRLWHSSRSQQAGRRPARTRLMPEIAGEPWSFGATRLMPAEADETTEPAVTPASPRSRRLLVAAGIVAAGIVLGVAAVLAFLAASGWGG
jgi:hypothetical protein